MTKKVINDLSQRYSENKHHRYLSADRTTLSLKEIDDHNFIMDYVDLTISQLVTDKLDIKKCFSYYESERNLDDFQYLTDNYGLGHPEEIKFVPLIKERVNILVGILLSQNLECNTTVADGESFKLQEREKFVNMTDTVINEILSDNNKLNAVLNPEKFKQAYGEDIKDFTGKSLIQKLMDDSRASYTDNFQETANALVEYAINSHVIQFGEKRKELFKNLIIGGLAPFEDKPSRIGVHPKQKVLDPRYFYLPDKYGEREIKKYDKAVYKEYMTKHDIIVEFGRYMTKDNILDLLSGDYSGASRNARNIYSGYDMTARGGNDEYGNYDMNRLYGTFSKELNESIYVYHVQYKQEALIKKGNVSFKDKIANIAKGEIDYDNNKGHILRQYLYKCVRVGEEMYINAGRVLNAKRSLDEPEKVELNFKGINLNINGKKPRSIVWDMVDIQDMYDILNFHLNNLIANSGVKGTFVNLAAIPKEWGATFEERLLKYMAYQKQGFAAVNPTQKGADKFNNYGSFDNGLDANAVNAIQLVKKSLEYDADVISGVNAPMRGQIEQHDAVHNVKVGIRQISLVTKEFFHYSDITCEEYLMSFLDLVKEAFPYGISFSYNENLQNRAFKALPQYYRTTNYVVSIKSIADDYDKLVALQKAAQELAAAELLDPEVVLDIMMEKTLQGAMNKLKRSIRDNKARNKVIEEMSKQLEQIDQQNKEQTKELEKTYVDLDKMKKELATMNIKSRELDIKEKYNEGDLNIKQEQLEVNRESEKAQAEERKNRTKLESEQLHLGKGSEVEVKNLD